MDSTKDPSYRLCYAVEVEEDVLGLLRDRHGNLLSDEPKIHAYMDNEKRTLCGQHVITRLDVELLRHGEMRERVTCKRCRLTPPVVVVRLGDL